MSLWKLRASLIGTLAVIIGLSTLFLAVILQLAGVSFMVLPFIVVVFNIFQWLISPYIVDAIYRVREIQRTEEPELYSIVENLSRKSSIKTPRLMLARIPIPNAFAYGSPIAGTRVAVTSGLLESLETEEVEAVIGHELGHLKHRDVQVMMFVSVLPAIFYYIGYSIMISSWYRGGGTGRDEVGGLAILIGIASIVVYFILHLFSLHLSRVREYYADTHSASIVEDGPRKLSEGLAKIANSTSRINKRYKKAKGLNAFKALFISDPDKAETDLQAMVHTGAVPSDRKLVEDVLRRKITVLFSIVELFASHPNIVKRLRALQELA
jgi:heat shock protein HtpX